MEKIFGLEILDRKKYEESRKIVIETKDGATAVAFRELNGIVNLSSFAKRFIGKSQSWFSQRLNGCSVMNKKRSFKENEYLQIAKGFRELADELIQHAEEIERSEMD